MMPNLFSGGNNSSIKFFEIRVNQDHLILRGSPDEASSVLLEGSIVLCTSEPLRVQGISMKFTGHARLPETRHLAQLNMEIDRHDFSFDDLGKISNTLPAGNLELPFSLVLPGTTCESVEGISDAWIVYRLKATIDRGLFAKNVDARRHIRIIRTFDASSLELAHGMSMDNIWPEKVKYNFSTPSKAIVFGSVAQVDYEFVPLVKGLKIGKVVTEVMETCRFNDPRMLTTSMRRAPDRNSTVVREEYQLPEDTETEDVDGREGYRFVRQLQLPRSLTKCRQTNIDEKWITIRHKYNFIVELINPDGHVSEIRASLPAHIFISPNNRLSEANELQGPIQINRADLGDISTLAPPLYGQHELDRLYGSVDTGRFITPFQSGRSTPYTTSKRASASSLAAVQDANTSQVSANTLQNRLRNLSSMEKRDRGVEFHHSTSDGDIQGMAGDTTTPPGGQAPQHIEYNDEELSRIPSYRTALREPFPSTTTSDLPDYFTSISRPATPPITTPRAEASTPTATEAHSPLGLGGTGSSTPRRRVHYAPDPCRD